MSDFDFINFLMINDVGKSTKNNEHLSDLRERAALLAKTTGQEPVSWYEFKQAVPKDEPKTLRNLGIGAVVGGAAGALLGAFFGPALPVFAVTGAFLGGAIGGFSDTENTRRNAMVTQYENYLDQFESTAGKSKTVSLPTGGLDNVKTTHAADLVADRLQPQNQGVSI